jgi:hypothetical protein
LGPDVSSAFVAYSELVGAVGGTCGVILAILKLREYSTRRPKAIASNLAPKLRELRRILSDAWTKDKLQQKTNEAVEYWRREFELKGHVDDLGRIGSRDLADEMGMLCILFPKTIDGTSIQPRLFWSYLSGETPKEFTDSATDPSKSRVWRSIVGSTIAEIDKVLEKAEGA